MISIPTGMESSKRDSRPVAANKHRGKKLTLTNALLSTIQGQWPINTSKEHNGGSLCEFLSNPFFSKSFGRRGWTAFTLRFTFMVPVITGVCEGSAQMS